YLCRSVSLDATSAAEYPTHTLDSAADCLRRFFRECETQCARAAVIDKEGLAGNVRNSAVDRGRQHLCCIGIAFELHQHEEPTRRFRPTRSIGSETLQRFEHCATTNFVEPSEFG